MHLKQLKLMQPIAVLAPPPRKYRHHNFGVLAPYWPHRAAAVAVALAQDAAAPFFIKTEKPSPLRLHHIKDS